jgi:hypothetical protein
MDLSELISTHRGARSYADLARDCGGSPTDKRLQQLARDPMKNFPDPASLRGLARGLKVSQSVVVLAAAESLGLDVRTSTPRLVELLPASAGELTEVQAAAVAHLVRMFTEIDDADDGWQPAEYDGPEPTVQEVLAARELLAVAQGGDPDDAAAVDEIARKARERYEQEARDRDSEG